MSSGFAPGDSDSDAGAKILAMEHMWAQAYVSKDPKALERILDDAFVNVDSDGKLQTKGDALAEVRTSTALQFLTESMAVQLHGSTAIVTGIFLIKGVDHWEAVCTTRAFPGYLDFQERAMGLDCGPGNADWAVRPGWSLSLLAAEVDESGQAL
jgi:ketosteroid isomerase-like protein